MLASITRLVSRSSISKPATRLYPAERREPYAAVRGHIRFIHDTCIFCTLCAKKCPTDAIVVDRKERRWTIDRRKCILCGSCVEACRKACLVCENERSAPFTQGSWDYMETHYDKDAGDAVGAVKPDEFTD